LALRPGEVFINGHVLWQRGHGGYVALLRRQSNDEVRIGRSKCSLEQSPLSSGRYSVGTAVLMRLLADWNSLTKRSSSSLPT
jgi:hypothetical protein